MPLVQWKAKAMCLLEPTLLDALKGSALSFGKEVVIGTYQGAPLIGCGETICYGPDIGW